MIIHNNKPNLSNIHKKYLYKLTLQIESDQPKCIYSNTQFLSYTDDRITHRIMRKYCPLNSDIYNESSLRFFYKHHNYENKNNNICRTKNRKTANFLLPDAVVTEKNYGTIIPKNYLLEITFWMESRPYRINRSCDKA